MSNAIQKEDARALLQSTQNLRLAWSSALTSLIGYTMIANVAIWSYFLKAYVDALNSNLNTQSNYIIIAASVSSILIGLWRLYTRYIDNQIANLYPDFLLYEGTLSVPPDHGSCGYLIRNVPNVDLILNANINLDKKINGIKELVERKCIGNRGHILFDIFAIVIIVMLLAASIIIRLTKIQSLLTIFCLAGISIGLLLVLLGILRGCPATYF